MSDSNDVTGAPKTRSAVPTPVHTSHTCCCYENNYCGCPKDFWEPRNLSKKSYCMIHYCGTLYGLLFSGISGCLFCAYHVAPAIGAVSPAICCCVFWSYTGYHELNGCQYTGCLCCGKRCCTDSYALTPCMCCDKPCCHWHCN